MGATYFRNMRPVSVLGLLAFLCCTHAWPNTHNDVQCEEAPRCDQAACDALGTENCHCSGNETSIKLDDRPQIVYLTFDDAFSALAEEQFYRILFNGTFKNPNGCAIRATHFLTQSYTDYSLVNRYWHMGHEMASHSISHRNDLNYWKNMEVDGWKDEMVGLRKMIGQFASIDPCEVKGHRAPFLQGGGDNMFTMLSENNFLYDSSWPTRAYGYVDAENGLYPYTLDFASIQDCPIEPCPKCSYPGTWVQPMIDLEDRWFNSNPQCPSCGNVCSMLDGCVIMDENPTKEIVFEMLMKNFKRVYEGETDEFGEFQKGNKAPWGLYMHAAWFFGDQTFKYEGYKMFLEEITDNTKYKDVYIVPINAGLEYMKKPAPSIVLENWGKSDISPFGCESIEAGTGKYAGNKCGGAQACKFDVHLPDEGIDGERYMTICKKKQDGSIQSCPPSDRYPWLEDHCGGNTPCKDCGDS